MCWQLLHPWYILFFLNQVGFGDFFCCETQLSAGELLVAGRQPPLEWNSRRPEEETPTGDFCGTDYCCYRTVQWYLDLITRGHFVRKAVKDQHVRGHGWLQCKVVITCPIHLLLLQQHLSCLVGVLWERERSSLFENKQNCFLFFHQHYIWLSGWSPTRISSQIPLRVQPEKQSDNLLDQSSDHLTHPMILLLFNNNNLCGVCYAPPTPPRQLSGKQGDHCCCKVISVTVWPNNMWLFCQCC